MIIFDLGCPQGHRFEGWFASREDFDRQAEATLVRCPVCDDAKVAIVPSSKVQVGRSAPPAAEAPTAVSGATATSPTATAVAESAATALGLPAEFVSKLREAIKATEDVGRRFPEEARKIHYDEVPARAIRGVATREEAAELREEGIEVATLPAFLTRESH